MKSTNFSKQIYLITLLSFFTACSKHTMPVKSHKEINGNKYELLFYDNFDGNKLNTKLWKHRTDNKHWSVQRADNVELKNGHLVLLLKKEKAEDKNYTGSGIISKETFQYGYYEARLKIPSGAGWHTSFWLMRHNDTTAEIEIDILENDSKHPNTYEIAFHTYPGGHKSIFGKSVKTPNMTEEFVLLGCEYTPEYVKYYRNNEQVKFLDISEYKHGPVNIWLTSIASWLGGTKQVDDTKLPGKAIIDYVKFYKPLE